MGTIKPTSSMFKDYNFLFLPLISFHQRKSCICFLTYDLLSSLYAMGPRCGYTGVTHLEMPRIFLTSPDHG